MLRDNLARVRERIRQACERVGRDAGSVTLVAVTKGLPVETIREAAALGITDVGENRVQEAIEKQYALGIRSLIQLVRWHLIGHLQRNKAKDAVELFGAIHSVDSMELAEELERQAARKGRGAGGKGQGEAAIDIFVQVNVSGEATKFGCRPGDALALARHVANLPHLRLQGLMTLAPFAESPEAARPYFRRLRELRDEVRAHLSPAPLAPCPVPLQLSMGMSHDFEVAVEEGADLVRIGTAIFGERDTRWNPKSKI